MAFWVIGDIHGMYDPLKKLLLEIKSSILPYDKIIFLGDYIDGGPASKEVIDLILDSKIPAVCLAGNHEDIMNHFLLKTGIWEKKFYGIPWFYNGAKATLLSFFNETQELKFIKNFFLENGSYCKEPDKCDKIREMLLSLDKKYLNFFENLIYGHKESLKITDKEYNFVFLHAGYMLIEQDKKNAHKNLQLTTEDIEEQCKPRKFWEYTEFWHKKLKLSPENTTIWTRKLLKTKPNNYILIHGHTPVSYFKNTILPKDYPDDKYFINDIDNQSFYSKKDNYSLSNIISIDIDTGAVYGNALTALYFGEKSLSEGLIFVFQIKLSKGFRKDEGFVKDVIKVVP